MRFSVSLHDSGNGYKVRLLLAMLGIAYDYVEVDILAGETQTRSIDPAGDVDWATFSLAHESGVVIQTSGTSGDTA